MISKPLVVFIAVFLILTPIASAAPADPLTGFFQWLGDFLSGSFVSAAINGNGWNPAVQEEGPTNCTSSLDCEPCTICNTGTGECEDEGWAQDGNKCEGICHYCDGGCITDGPNPFEEECPEGECDYEEYGYVYTGECLNGECEKTPAPEEVCDGYDNDCDGYIDEELYNDPSMPDCSGECPGVPVCSESGEWYCDYSGSYGYPCRDVEGPCDEAEMCTGESPECPTNTFLPEGAEAGCPACQKCNGYSASCENFPNGYKDEEGENLCDATCKHCENGNCVNVGEGNDDHGDCQTQNPDCGTQLCDGQGACGFKPNTHVCRWPEGDCDEMEKCSGTSDECPSDEFLPEGAKSGCPQCEHCNGKTATCAAIPEGTNDPEEPCESGDCKPGYCDGEGSCAVEPQGTSCEDGQYCTEGDECNDAGECTAGSPKDCSSNNIVPIGQCDLPLPDGDGIDTTWDFRAAFLSTCNEDANACTTGDTSVTSTCSVSKCGAECDDSTPCDNKCDGTMRYANGVCQANCTCNYLTVGDCADLEGECAVGAGPGKVYTGQCGAEGDTFHCLTGPAPAEVCDGEDNDCDGEIDEGPMDNDESKPDCKGSAADACDGETTCEGSSGWSACDYSATANVQCRASFDVCDVAEKCSGTAPDCPPNGVKPNGSVCRNSAGDCDVAEYCDGATITCPENKLKEKGEHDCPVCKECSGTSPVCSNLPNGEDDDGSYLCQMCKTCEAGVCNPIANLKPDTEGYETCDECKWCNGAGACIPAPEGWKDIEGDYLCDQTCEECNGGGACVKMDHVPDVNCDMCAVCLLGDCYPMPNGEEDDVGLTCNDKCWMCNGGKQCVPRTGEDSVGDADSICNTCESCNNGDCVPYAIGTEDNDGDGRCEETCRYCDGNGGVDACVKMPADFADTQGPNECDGRCQVCQADGTCDITFNGKDRDGDDASELCTDVCEECKNGACGFILTGEEDNVGDGQGNFCQGECKECDGLGACRDIVNKKDTVGQTKCDAECKWCDANAKCSAIDGGDPLGDCDAHDKQGILGGCNWIPDDNPFTNDYKPAYDSECSAGACTTGDSSWTHTCDAGCGAPCVEDTDCFITECNHLDGCYDASGNKGTGPTYIYYRNYTDVPNTCLASCDCTLNVCTAYTTPAPPAEDCNDGIDNDCDGDIDYADSDCCSPTPEVCDGIDNDCDGDIDEDASGSPLTQPCYTGPAGTEGVGICQAGTETCTGGSWGSCVGEVTPTAETCTEGLDNDCDTLTDCLDTTDCAGKAGPGDSWCCDTAADCVGDDDYDDLCNIPRCALLTQTNPKTCAYPKIANNVQDTEGSQLCNGLCEACDGAGNCGFASEGHDPGEDCPQDTSYTNPSLGCATGVCDGAGACGYLDYDDQYCPACQTCVGATSPACVNYNNNVQDTTGPNYCDSYNDGICAACQDGVCSIAEAGYDPGDECWEQDCGTGFCSGTENSCGYQTSGKGQCGMCYTCEGADNEDCVQIYEEQDSEGGCDGTCQWCSGGDCQYVSDSSADPGDHCPENPGEGDYCSGEGEYCEYLGYCGDGEVQSPNADGQNEECDGDESPCTAPYGGSCQYCSSCEYITIEGPYCGDGNIDAGYEQCDDGNTLPGDGCSSTCQFEAVCGNGVVEPTEQCDDNNTLNGDCCSSTCQFETSGSTCNDGLYCIVGETCDGAGSCVGSPKDCSDGVDCTVDSCTEAGGGQCVHTPDNALCPEDGTCAGTTGTVYTGVCSATEGCTTEPAPAEDCSDGIDNDCDGYTDCLDSDCIEDPYCIGDEDGDGVPDAEDKCPGTDLTWVPSEGLKNNHYDNTNINFIETYGCGAEQILFCKPGNNNGESKWGITEGTLNVWINQEGWALECQVDGEAVLAGEAKSLFENTDGSTDAWIFDVDLIDTDDDNDGVPDTDDSMEEDGDPPGTPGHGKPDWWERARGLK